MINDQITLNLKNFDFFYKNLTFSYKKKYSYDSNIGGILSIINIFLIAFLFIHYFNNYLSGKNFTIFTNESYDPKTSVEFTNIPIAFEIQDSIELSPYLGDIKLKLGNCEQNSNFIYYNDLQKYHNISCIEYSKEIKLLNKYENGLKIIIEKKNNLKQELNEISLNILFLSYVFNISQKEDINKIIIPKIYTKKINISLFKLDYQINYYLSFESAYYFINDNCEKKFHIFKNIESEYKLNYNESIISEINFISNEKIVKYYKTKENFLDILSKIGGLINLILLITKKINYSIINKIFLLDLHDYFSLQKQNFKEYYNHNLIQMIYTNTFFNASTFENKTKILKKTIKENDNSNINLKIIKNASNVIPINNNNNKNIIKTVNEIHHENINSYPNILKSRSLIKKNKYIKTETNISIYKKMVFYILPECVTNKIRGFNEIISIKNSVRNIFSYENIYKLIMFEKFFYEKNILNSLNENRTFQVNVRRRNEGVEINNNFRELMREHSPDYDHFS